MSEDDRLEWCMAALATIGDMPEDLLDEACRAGRRRCDHPAKIVPFICDDESKTVKPWLDTLKRRKEELRVRGILFANVNAPRLEKHEPQYMTAQDLAEIKAELAGALSANRSDLMTISKQEIEAKRTANGGWTKAQLEAWGIPWPPPKGWKKQLERN